MTFLLFAGRWAPLLLGPRTTSSASSIAMSTSTFSRLLIVALPSLTLPLSATLEEQQNTLFDRLLTLEIEVFRMRFLMRVRRKEEKEYVVGVRVDDEEGWGLGRDR